MIKKTKNEFNPYDATFLCDDRRTAHMLKNIKPLAKKNKESQK